MRNNDLSKDEDFDLSQALFKFLPWWPIFVLLITMALGAAYIYLRYTIPVYEISANILIKNEKGKGGVESSFMESINMFGSNKIVENEIELLKSRSLMRQVVNNLQLYAPVSDKGRVKDVSAYVASPIKVEVKHLEDINEIDKVYFTYDSARQKISIGKQAYPLNQWAVFQGDTLRFILNPNYSAAKERRQLYFSLVNFKRIVASFVSKVKIATVNKQASVITLKIEDEVQARGEDILNELIRVYNKAAIQDKNILASNTLAFVEDRLRSVTAELGEVESNIQNFKSNKGIVDISSQGQLFLQGVEANDKKIADINMQLAVLSQVEKYVLSKPGNSGIVPSTLGVNDPVLSQLLQTLFELQLQYERLRKTTAENNPLLVSLKDQIDRVTPNIIENIRNQRNNLVAAETNLNTNSSRYSSLLRNIPQNERELLEISREQVIKNNIYTFLLQKREETALSFASTVADSRIVDTAESSLLPVSPKRSLVYGIALILALAVGIGIVTVKEFLNQNILFRSEIEKYVSWPVIGEIAFEDTDKQLVIGEGQRTVLAEQFRHIRTTLAYLGISESQKRILITSSISGEGKSFVAANIAMTLALTSKKVVLLELDLRKPKLAPIFNINRDKGISTFLIGKCRVEEIIHQTQAHNNLYFISAGPIPPNPSELILGARMNQLLEQLGTIFDYIIIDTAPVAPVTDAHILSKLCDATLFVVRHGYTPKAHIKHLEENNKVRGLKNVAIIFNGLKGRGFGKYGYGYGYGYGYSYGNSGDGYVEDEPKKKKVSKSQ